MLLSSRWRHAFLAGWCLLAVFFVDTAAAAAVSAPENFAQMLKQADDVKTSDHAEFTVLLQRLGDDVVKLSPEQRLYLRYLRAWQSGYLGDYEAATPQLKAVIAESSDATLRFRAGITVVNMLAIGSHYEDAYTSLSQLLDQLPRVTDKDARMQGLGVASDLYNQGGQYDLALSYANQVLKENSTSGSACKGGYLKVEALSRSGKLRTLGDRFQGEIDACIKAGEPVFANLIRTYVATFDIQHGRSSAAIGLLQKYNADAQHTRYLRLISQFDALLAQAYWKEGNLTLAKQFAFDAVHSSIPNEYTEPLVTAYEVLYRVAQKEGDMGAALAYHERYMGADKAFLNEVSAKALAFQTVKQQVLAKKLQIDTLNKQNQILHLQQALGKKAAETSRLYFIVLLLIVAFMALWAYRVKRSQLRFMKLSRRDGLTGIFNRQHFVSTTEQSLQSCKKSSRDVCFILMDLDNFKAVNDTHGHVVGDHVLKRAVEACKGNLRPNDILGRLGGEEFGILLPGCTREQGFARAELIRLAIAAIPGSEEDCTIAISASLGVAAASRSGYALRQLLVDADAALYRAKNAGRNRVVLADDTDQCLVAS